MCFRTMLVFSGLLGLTNGLAWSATAVEGTARLITSRAGSSQHRAQAAQADPQFLRLHGQNTAYTPDRRAHILALKPRTPTRSELAATKDVPVHAKAGSSYDPSGAGAQFSFRSVRPILIAVSSNEGYRQSAEESSDSPAAAPKLGPESGTATIVVYQPADLHYAVTSVALDGIEVAVSRPSRYFTLLVKPGIHILSAPGEGREARIDTRSKGIYFVQPRPLPLSGGRTLTTFKLEESLADALERAADCKPLEPGYVKRPELVSLGPLPQR